MKFARCACSAIIAGKGQASRRQAWRMAGAFGWWPQHAAPPFREAQPRRKPAIFVSADHPAETIKVPTAYEAMQHAQAADGAWVEPDAEHGRVHRPVKRGSPPEWCAGYRRARSIDAEEKVNMLSSTACESEASARELVFAYEAELASFPRSISIGWYQLQ
jgi:hypothetical protein